MTVLWLSEFLSLESWSLYWKCALASISINASAIIYSISHEICWKFCNKFLWFGYNLYHSWCIPAKYLLIYIVVAWLAQGQLYDYPSVHYNNVIMSPVSSQITSVLMVCSTVYSGVDLRKHQSSMPLAFMRGIHRWPVNSPHKGPVTWKMLSLMTSSCSEIILKDIGEVCQYQNSTKPSKNLRTGYIMGHVTWWSISPGNHFWSYNLITMLIV